MERWLKGINPNNLDWDTVDSDPLVNLGRITVKGSLKEALGVPKSRVHQQAKHFNDLVKALRELSDELSELKKNPQWK